MAYKKNVTVELTCEGVCGGDPITVPSVPPDWSRLKVQRASVPNYMDATTHRALLCPRCAQLAIDILLQNGFQISTLAPSQRKR